MVKRIKALMLRGNMFCCFLAENSTDIIGDPLEGTSDWFWNNTDLVRLSFYLMLFKKQTKMYHFQVNSFF